MSEDIVTRLRSLALEFPTLDGIMDSEWTNAAEEIERLRHELDGARLAYRGASYDRDRMRSERDEARRSVCCGALPPDYMDWKPSAVDSALKLIAAQHGWDCFKEASNEQ